jgi:hypothetical protein
MKKFIIVLMFLVTGCTFGHFLTDTSAVRISGQDSIGVWDSTMIFAVQKKLSSVYHWKKMYMWQLRHILNDSLKLNNLMIPRLAGTSTTNISLKTFATNTLYRADFNYNFRKIDSLVTEFSLSDFKVTGDTVSLKHPVTVDTVNKWVSSKIDTTKIPYLAKNNNFTGSYNTFKNPVRLGLATYWAGQFLFYNDINSNTTTLVTGIPTGNIILNLPITSGTLVTSDSSSTHNWVKTYVDTVAINSLPSVAYGGLFNDYASSHLYVPLVGSTFKTLKGMTTYNIKNVTATDSSMVIQKAGTYLYSISATIEDTTSGSVFAALFINGTRVPVVSAILPTSSTNQRVTFALNSNLILHVGDILLFKFQGTVPHNEVIVWNVNIMVQKL